LAPGCGLELDSELGRASIRLLCARRYLEELPRARSIAAAERATDVSNTLMLNERPEAGAHFAPFASLFRSLRLLVTRRICTARDKLQDAGSITLKNPDGAKKVGGDDDFVGKGDIISRTIFVIPGRIGSEIPK